MSTPTVVPTTVTPPSTPTINVQALVTQITNSFQNPIITLAILPQFIPLVIAKVQVLEGLSTQQQEQVVVSVITQLIQLSNIPAAEKEALITTFNVMGVAMINVALDIANGVYNIGKTVVQDVESKCKCC